MSRVLQPSHGVGRSQAPGLLGQGEQPFGLLAHHPQDGVLALVRHRVPLAHATSWNCSSDAAYSSSCVPGEVHQRVAEQLDLDAVRVLEVHRLLDAQVRPGVLHALRVQLVAQALPAVAGHRDGDVLDAADRLDARLEPEAGEVEEAEQGLVAEVEEEVRGAVVVAVLDQLDQREAEQTLVELDGLLDVGADQRGVMDAAARGVPLGRRQQVAVPQLAAPGLQLDQLGVRGWHGELLPKRGRSGHRRPAGP